MLNPQLTKKIILWSVFVLGLFGLMILLAKMSVNNGAGKTNPDLKTPVTIQDHFEGSAEAANVIVEYTDFQCPGCALYYPIAKQLVKEMPGKIKLVFRHFPLRNIHANAQLAAQASEAAGLQGKFWEMHDVLFNTQDSWSALENPAEKFTEYAVSLGMDASKFSGDLTSQSVVDKVNNDYKSAMKNGLNGTPTFFLNGKLIESLPQSVEEFKKLIQP